MSKPPRKRYWVGFDLGGTKMLAKVFGPDLREVGARRRRTRTDEGQQAGLARVIETVRQALEAAKVDLTDVAGVGIGVPGPVDLDRGVVLDTPNLGWRRLPLRQKIERALGCPVAVLNDVDAGVYGEHRRGAAVGARCVAGIFPGTGIGGGCVYEGRILRGKERSCFEIGHCSVLPDGPLCGCGQRGCLEAVASRLAIASAAAAAAHRGEAPHLREAVGTDVSNIRSADLAEAVAAGDKAVEWIVRDAARWLGVGVAFVVNLLDPDVVVLGGGLVGAMPALFLKEVSDSAKKHAMPALAGNLKVVLSALGDDATVLGAAAWVRDACAVRAGVGKKRRTGR